VNFIRIPLPPNLPQEWQTLYATRIKALSRLGTEQEIMGYVKEHSGWGALKNWLKQFSSDKCWYCEAKSYRAPIDVDHFRPKLGTTVDKVKHATHKGYYWLAYEWSNFRLSCQRCNRPEGDEQDVLRGKNNEFPIQAETTRCNNVNGDLNDEDPRLLDPCVETDCMLLLHAINGEVKPNSDGGTWDYQRARYTIELLGFNSWNAPEDKRSRWQDLNILIDLADQLGNTDAVESVISKHISSEYEYSSYFRSAVSTHRGKAWVEALL
jgi:uncharacterized protein (TIGR02646 family)